MTYLRGVLGLRSQHCLYTVLICDVVKTLKVLKEPTWAPERYTGSPLTCSSARRGRGRGSRRPQLSSADSAGQKSAQLPCCRCFRLKQKEKNAFSLRVCKVVQHACVANCRPTNAGANALHPLSNTALCVTPKFRESKALCTFVYDITAAVFAGACTANEKSINCVH